MTVIPFAARTPSAGAGTGPPLATMAAVTGSFCSPSGRAGSFTGTYRLERVVSEFGLLAAAGVFTGELTDADGRRLGVGSRRQTAAIEVEALPGKNALVVTLGPLDVNILGFLVAVNEMRIDVCGASRRRASSLGH